MVQLGELIFIPSWVFVSLIDAWLTLAIETAVGKLGTGEGWKSWQLHLKCEEFVKIYRSVGRDIFGVNRFLVIETWALFYGEY